MAAQCPIKPAATLPKYGSKIYWHSPCLCKTPMKIEDHHLGFECKMVKKFNCEVYDDVT